MLIILKMPMIEVDPMSIDQLAGAVVLFLGSVGSLLLVVWQSKCHCKVNLCYIFQCERRPPNEEEMKTLKDQSKKLKDKGTSKKKEDKILEKEDEILEQGSSLEQRTPRDTSVRLVPKTSKDLFYESQPEPEPSIDRLV
jgi:hypothetical protein